MPGHPTRVRIRNGEGFSWRGICLKLGSELGLGLEIRVWVKVVGLGFCSKLGLGLMLD